MITNKIFLFAAVLASLAWNALPVQPACTRCPDPIPSSVREEALRDATVQIRLIPPGAGEEAEVGLGTLVAHAGQTYLITHNRWEAFDYLDRVQILSARGELLAELKGVLFQNLIVYSDKGALILRSPLGKSVGGVPLGNARAATSGDTVTIAYLPGDPSGTVSFLTGEVKQVGKRRGDAVFLLSVSNGDEATAESAGGGVWLDGKFVGNLWQVKAYSRVAIKKLFLTGSTQEMHAAQSSIDLLQMLPLHLLPSTIMGA